MSKEKAIEKIQYAAMQIASVYACSAIFDEKTKVIEDRQKELEKAIINLHDALKELEGIMYKLNIKKSILEIVEKNNLEILKIDLCNDYEFAARFYGGGRDAVSSRVYTTLEDLDFEVDSIFMQGEVQGTVYCQDKDTKEPVWIVPRGDEGGSWWEVNRVPDFYKRKALNEIKSLLISARNKFRNAIDGVMIPPDERYREKSKAFEKLEKALKELGD